MTLEFITQAAIAGILATYVHLVLALWAPCYGLPRLDFSAGIAAISWGDSFKDSPPPYWMGFIAIHLNGIFFALLYASVFGPLLPGEPVIRGAIYGAILWVGSQLIFVPFFLKGGFFGLKESKLAWLTAVVVHGTYGMIVGWLSPVL